MKEYQERFRTAAQRVEHIRKWMSDLECWRFDRTVALERWTVNGAPIRTGDLWPTTEGVLEFEYGEVRVPDEWSVGDARLCLDMGGESRIVIGYSGGKTRECGMNPHHRWFPVEGRAFTLRAESVARDLFGKPRSRPRLESAFLALACRELEDFLRELGCVADAAVALGSHEAVPRLLEIAETALARLDWPTETTSVLGRIVSHPETQTIWKHGIPDGVPAPLESRHRESLVAQREFMISELAQLRIEYPKTGIVNVAGHAHIDYVWLWPMDETVRKARRTFGTQTMLMDKYPDFHFVQSQAALYDDIEREDPALFAEIAQKVRAGQWEPIGGMWVESDTNMPTAEGFNRQFLYGQTYFRSRFGVTCKTAWLPDTFGFTAALPQLFRQAGLNRMLTIKVTWNEKNELPDNLFTWTGNDGSSVLVYTFEAPEFGGYNMELGPRSVHKVWSAYRNKTIYPRTLASFGHGDGGGGPMPEQIECVEGINRMPVIPKAERIPVETWFDNLESAIEGANLPEWRGEIYLEYHRGTFTTQSAMKRLMRRTEYALAEAELLESLLWMKSGKHSEGFAEAWKTVLRNQFHDALPGSSIREVYEKAERDLAGICEIAESASKKALSQIVTAGGRSGNNARVEKCFASANPSGCEIPNFKLETQESLPESWKAQKGSDGRWIVSSPEHRLPLALETRNTIAAPGPLAIGERMLENRFVRIEIDGEGRIGRIFDKTRNRECLEGPGNRIWVYRDRPRNYDAWDIEANFELGGIELIKPESIRVTETGPHRGEITVTKKFGDASVLTQRYRLWADSPRLDINTTIDLHDRRLYLRSLTGAAVLAEYATCEQAVGVVRRPVNDNTFWQRAQFESPAHRFIDLSETGFGLMLMNDAKFGHSVKRNVMSISLVKAPFYPDAYADEGTQTFTYSLLPHGGEWWANDVRAEAADLNRPQWGLAIDSAPSRWQPIRLSGSPLEVLALKQAEDGKGLILRTVETEGRRGIVDVTMEKPFAIFEQTNTLEDSLGKADFSIAPFGMQSWRLTKS